MLLGDVRARVGRDEGHAVLVFADWNMQLEEDYRPEEWAQICQSKVESMAPMHVIMLVQVNRGDSYVVDGVKVQHPTLHWTPCVACWTHVQTNTCMRTHTDARL